jgi:pyruvate,water dikinase
MPGSYRVLPRRRPLLPGGKLPQLGDFKLSSPGVSTTVAATPLVIPFDRASAVDASVAGGKGASLSRMAQAGLPVPPGFIVCAGAFHEFLENDGRLQYVRTLAGRLNVHNEPALDEASRELREIVLSGELPQRLRATIDDLYASLGDDAVVAVRSSACSEDGETASYAGQQETFLNVQGGEAVARRVQECWASFFTPRALFYRGQKGDLADAAIAVVVQEMVPAEKSGVLFTADPVQRRRDHMVIEAAYGLGEAVVSGSVTPDHYVIDREDGSLVRKFIPGGNGSAPVLSSEELGSLRQLGEKLEAFFGKPQDIEWCIQGGEIFLLQSRPITTL